MQPDEPPNDSALLLNVSHGDQHAFSQLIDLYADTVYRYVLKLTHEEQFAEEVVQDVFLQLWQTRESLPEIQNFGGYLYVVTRNYTLNALKKLLREKNRFIRWENEIISDPEDSPEKYYQELLDNAIAKLPPQQQKVWILTRQLRMSYTEVAAEMGISKETVKKYLQAATKNITDQLQSNRQIPVAVLIKLFFE